MAPGEGWKDIELLLRRLGLKCKERLGLTRISGLTAFGVGKVAERWIWWRLSSRRICRFSYCGGSREGYLHRMRLLMRWVLGSLPGLRKLWRILWEIWEHISTQPARISFRKLRKRTPRNSISQLCCYILWSTCQRNKTVKPLPRSE